MQESPGETLYVLLYYKYVDLAACRSEVTRWISSLCAQLRLAGRIRVATDGINVVVSSNLAAPATMFVVAIACEVRCR